MRKTHVRSSLTGIQIAHFKGAVFAPQFVSVNKNWHSEIDPESCQSKPDLDCNYTFPIDLSPIRIPNGDKSIEKMVITILLWFELTRFRIDFSVCITLKGVISQVTHLNHRFL